MTPEDIIKATNAYRKAQGLSELKINPMLQRAADERAKDMANTQNFSHKIATTTPGMDSAWGFIRKNGYPVGSPVGENLAVDFNAPDQVVNAWRNSPSHNQNLISKDYNEIGLAVVPGMYRGKQTYYVVQFLGGQKAIPTAIPTKTPNPTAVKKPAQTTRLEKVKPQRNIIQDRKIPWDHISTNNMR